MLMSHGKLRVTFKTHQLLWMYNNDSCCRTMLSYCPNTHLAENDYDSTTQLKLWYLLKVVIEQNVLDHFIRKMIFPLTATI